MKARHKGVFDHERMDLLLCPPVWKPRRVNASIAVRILAGGADDLQSPFRAVAR